MSGVGAVGPSPDEIRKRLMIKWERGLFFSQDEELFPLRVSLGTLSPVTMTNRYDEVRKWVSLYYSEGLDKVKPARIEWKEINHRQLGNNRLPCALIFDRPEELAAFLGRKTQWKSFHELRDQLSRADDRLGTWADKVPFDLLDCAPHLESLILLWRWMMDHSRPGVYLRQIDLPGIDTKFTEGYKKLLAAWLDLTMPPELIRSDVTGVKNFEIRYGFRKKPELIRLRFLDPLLYWKDCSDLSMPSEEFCSLFANDLPAPVKNVFVIENDITALAFPAVEQGLVIFGRGYNFDSWKEAQWINHVNLWYWGDLDTHGFGILDQFRSAFPHARSFLMDRETLLANKSHWGTEPQQNKNELTRLTPEEAMVYDDLRLNRLEKNLRLEQEFIRFYFLEKFLSFLKKGNPL